MVDVSVLLVSDEYSLFHLGSAFIISLSLTESPSYLDIKIRHSKSEMVNGLFIFICRLRFGNNHAVFKKFKFPIRKPLANYTTSNNRELFTIII